jgi:TolB-like protein
MSSAAAPADLSPVLPRPSIFISYASENRAAARLLRDTLAASGLDVWYDENELGGGDAWDQKIRRQIRECTFFMPVISAQTEARREGYFRREWRLAVDRSHDMADDVMFLLPVVIDGTSEAGARVPEKFLTVQWLRLPGGVATPALTALAARLAHGEHIAPTRAAAFVPPPPVKTTPVRPIKAAPADSHAEGPPPMPHFPVRPADRRDNLKYFAEILWWILTTAWLLFKRLPKWARILVVIWVIMLLFRSSDEPNTPHKSKPAGIKTVAALEPKDAERLRETAAELEKVAADPSTGNIGAGFARAGAELAKAISKEVAGAPAAGPLGVVPFNTGASDPAARKFADDVFERVFGQLTLARPGRVSVRPTADPAADDATLRALAAAAGEDRLLLARFEPAAGKTAFVVRLLAVKTAKVIWTATYEIDAANAADVAGQITQAVLKAHALKPPPPPPAAP